MKKSVIITLLIIVVVSLSYFGYNAIQKRAKLNAVETKIKKLPRLSFYNINKSVFNYAHQPKQQTLIIYFHPECEHCQYEAKQILAHKKQFNNTQILMISPAPLAQIEQFNTDYQLTKITSLKVLWDKERKFESYFGNSTFPTVLIYDEQNQLQKKYKGEVKIEAILKHLTGKHHQKISETLTHSSSGNHFTDFNIMISLFDLGL